MSLTTDADALRLLASQVVPTFVGRAATGTPVPYACVYGGGGVPWDRALSGTTPDRQATYRLMAVSNNATGCRIVSNRLISVIDGAQFDGAPWMVEMVSDPLEDTTDPSNPRWSSTIEIRHYTRS